MAESRTTPYVEGIDDSIAYLEGCTFSLRDAPTVESILALLRSFKSQGGFQKHQSAAVESSELERLREFQRKIEEAEARCCPEDVGFEEWIGVLKKRLDTAQSATRRIDGVDWCVLRDGCYQPGLCREEKRCCHVGTADSTAKP